MWDSLRGHRRQLELFRSAAQNGRLSQAYLFAGETGVGKRRFARLLAGGLFCDETEGALDACGVCPSCKQVLADTHPDLLQVGCPPDKTEVPIELLAGSREKRGREGLCYEISLKPAVADRRIAIIDDVEKLNVASANTLLKTLEEPPARTLFFLIVDRVDAVLPTIRSRCQLVQFQPLNEDDVSSLLLENGMAEDAESAASIAALSGGSLDAAAQLADPSVRALNDLVSEAITGRGLERSMNVASEVVSAIQATSGDTKLQRSSAMWTLRFLAGTLQAALRASARGESSRIELIDATGNDAVDRLTAMLERVMDTEQQLRQSMPLVLCLESLFDDLRRLATRAVA